MSEFADNLMFKTMIIFTKQKHVVLFRHCLRTHIYYSYYALFTSIHIHTVITFCLFLRILRILFILTALLCKVSYIHVLDTGCINTTLQCAIVQFLSFSNNYMSIL